MKKAIWLSFAISLVLVNLAAWLVEQYTGLYIVMIFRVALILGISMITAIFAGAFALVNSFEEERPLTGQTHDTLQSLSTPSKSPEESENDE